MNEIGAVHSAVIHDRRHSRRDSLDVKIGAAGSLAARRFIQRQAMHKIRPKPAVAN